MLLGPRMWDAPGPAQSQPSITTLPTTPPGVGPDPFWRQPKKLGSLKAAAGRGKGHLLLKKEQAMLAVARAWPDDAGKGLFPTALLPAFPAQSRASHRLQLLAQRKWLLAGAHSCFPHSVCCFQFNVPGSWIGTAQGEHSTAFPCTACLQENPFLTLRAGAACPAYPWRENPLAGTQG